MSGSRQPEWPLTSRVEKPIYDHVFASPGNEVGGVLVGRLLADKAIVMGSIPALEAQGERASVTFTHDAWATIHQALEHDHPDQQIVGWYHSHPGFGIFLSSQDLFIQENFFSDPRHLALVIDPHRATEGLFGWDDGEIVLLDERRARHKPVLPASGSDQRRDATDGPRLAITLVLLALVGLVVGLGLAALFFEAGRPPATTVTIRTIGIRQLPTGQGHAPVSTRTGPATVEPGAAPTAAGATVGSVPELELAPVTGPSTTVAPSTSGSASGDR